MPVNEKTPSEIIYQRDQYQKGGIGKIYWDYRDNVTLNFLSDKDQKILDVGCGEGITLEKAAQRFPYNHIQGIDFIKENVAICRQHNLISEEGDVYNLNGFADASIDAVIFMEVIEHLDHPDTAIDEIFRVLKPGGKVVIVFPNDGVFKLARLITLKFKEAAYDPGHVHQWTPYEMNSFLKDHGFTVVKTQAIPFYIWSFSLHGVVWARKNG